MKSIIFLFIILFSSHLTIGQNCCNESFLKYPLKTIITYCQNKTVKPYSRIVLIYDSSKYLIRQSVFVDSIEISRVIFNYNYHGQIESKDFYSLKTNLEYDRTRIFKYDKQQRLIYEGFNDERGNNTKKTYSYNDKGLLDKITTECNYNRNIDLLEYNSQNQLIKKFDNYGLDIKYEYLDQKLIKETHYERSRNIVYNYIYNKNGLVETKLEDGKTVESNVYKDGIIVERFSSYFGIDPCFYPCCNQYNIKFEYY